MGEEGYVPDVIEGELSTGIIISGAYARKLRRTLFAQLSEYVRRDKEGMREVARASGELNRVLYAVIVEGLKSEKGDAVRIRIKYKYYPKDLRVVWDYDSLRVEFFRKQPDEEVDSIVRNALETRLREILDQYALMNVVGSASAKLLGETVAGGLLFQLIRGDENIGVASVEPAGDRTLLDAIVVLHGDRRAYRMSAETYRTKDVYRERPDLLVRDIAGSQPAPISYENAQKMIADKLIASRAGGTT